MSNHIQSILRRLRSNDEGVTAIEYALIASLIAVAIIAGAAALGGNINTKFSSVAVTVSN